MSIFQKIKSFLAPTVPNPLPPLVQPDPKPVVEIETVLTVAPEKESAVAMPTQPFQVPVTNTDPTPPSWPFPGTPPAEAKKAAPVKKPKKQQFEKKATAAAITATPAAPAPKKPRSTKKNK